MRGDTVRYDPRLIEEAVLLRLRGHPESKRFYRERNRLYEIENPEKRERNFQHLDRSWFIHLRLAEPIEQAIDEQPSLESVVRYCLVAPARKRGEEEAELFVIPEEGLEGKEKPTVRILLRPESFLKPSALLTFLRHELLHITDMLDPAFGYQPVLPVGEGGPAYDALLRERYRVLWDATIDGRMIRRGWLPDSLRSQHLDLFRRTFPMLGEQTEQHFSRFFDIDPHTHGELVAVAQNPGATPLAGTSKFQPGGRCPLCHFPTHTFEPDPEALDGNVIAEINRDFPDWQPSLGLCRQCADLYRARRLSLAAAAQLPGSDFHS